MRNTRHPTSMQTPLSVKMGCGLSPSDSHASELIDQSQRNGPQELLSGSTGIP
ncbi:hypothetical protein JZ751_023485 [Albula glossodonta]|uniref:Uncharacterized protein n=1 Tax=Albula glossodonta TaxID=121402 RepID=A0A8T2NHV3_9TELE|nr:hypothetical protein JZ751_023485 [Albula glossodonta]